MISTKLKPKSEEISLDALHPTEVAKKSPTCLYLLGFFEIVPIFLDRKLVRSPRGRAGGLNWLPLHYQRKIGFLVGSSTFATFTMVIWTRTQRNRVVCKHYYV